VGGAAASGGCLFCVVFFRFCSLHLDVPCSPGMLTLTMRCNHALRLLLVCAGWHPLDSLGVRAGVSSGGNEGG
jgi:hypothetical protein